jgi:hypothetical protein
MMPNNRRLPMIAPTPIPAFAPGLRLLLLASGKGVDKGIVAEVDAGSEVEDVV